MTNKRLGIVEVTNQPVAEQRLPSRRVRKQEMQAKYERIWLLKPEQCDSKRNCMERERLERTYHLIQDYLHIAGKRIVDLGCGDGALAKRLRNEGGIVQAVDIASNALKRLQQDHAEDIEVLQDALPETSLPDNSYDLVISMDVIAELNTPEYRLFFAELARLVKSTGYVVCSTPVDIHSEGALQRLADLAHTEFNITQWIYSYHALYLRLIDFFSSPGSFVKAFKDISYRQSELQARTGFRRIWFKCNSMLAATLLWNPISCMTNPLTKWLRQSRYTLLKLEKICRFFSDANGISHAIFIGQRRPLEIPEFRQQPVEKSKKREIWE
jgi:2-polyprenyl-3-methyl-5-hydroxy-6-metoxy-1,4-benzoquinol methylase